MASLSVGAWTWGPRRGMDPPSRRREPAMQPPSAASASKLVQHLWIGKRRVWKAWGLPWSLPSLCWFHPWVFPCLPHFLSKWEAKMDRAGSGESRSQDQPCVPSSPRQSGQSHLLRQESPGPSVWDTPLWWSLLESDHLMHATPLSTSQSRISKNKVSLRPACWLLPLQILPCFLSIRFFRHMRILKNNITTSRWTKVSFCFHDSGPLRVRKAVTIFPFSKLQGPGPGGWWGGLHPMATWDGRNQVFHVGKWVPRWQEWPFSRCGVAPLSQSMQIREVLGEGTGPLSSSQGNTSATPVASFCSWAAGRRAEVCLIVAASLCVCYRHACVHVSVVCGHRLSKPPLSWVPSWFFSSAQETILVGPLSSVALDCAYRAHCPRAPPACLWLCCLHSPSAPRHSTQHLSAQRTEDSSSMSRDGSHITAERHASALLTRCSVPASFLYVICWHVWGAPQGLVVL